MNVKFQINEKNSNLTIIHFWNMLTQTVIEEIHNASGWKS